MQVFRNLIHSQRQYMYLMLDGVIYNCFSSVLKTYGVDNKGLMPSRSNEAHPASYPVGAGGSICQGKVTGA
jgi:hypothetical protein